MTRTTSDILALNAFDAGNAGRLAPDVASLIARRRKSFGAASVLFYRQPLQIVRGHGAILTAADGRTYLAFTTTSRPLGMPIHTSWKQHPCNFAS
jgi:4-aminobutyrate aminotransferase-like enzyme